MAYPVVPVQPPLTLGDPTTPTQKENVLPANTSPTLALDAGVVALSPNNTGLPVNIPVILQKANSASTGSVASLAQAFTNANKAGNTIIVQCACGNGTAMTVADSLGNTYTQAATEPNSTTFEAAIFFATNIVAGANTVTVTNAGTTASMAMQIYEVSGLLAQVAAQPDASRVGTGTSATPALAAFSASSPNSLAFMGIAVGTAAQAASVTSGTSWTLDSTQNTTTPSGLFTFGAFSQYIANLYPVIPTATIASSEPYAAVAAIFKPVVMGVQGTVNLASDYPYGATPITADSGNQAAATATATLAAVAGKTTYITGYVVTASGATAASVVTGTITGIITGTQHFTYTAIAGVTLACQPLVVTLPKPIPASAVNTTIAVALPSLGSGNTNATVQAFGYQL